LKNEIEKDNMELEKQKTLFIESLKNLKKEDIIHDKKKLTLWQKIKRVILA